jgi:hypothetical protein
MARKKAADYARQLVRGLFRITVVLMILLNVIVLGPSLYFSIATGHYTATIVAASLSAVTWVGLWLAQRAIRAHLRRKREEQVVTFRPSTSQHR